jgi:asparagine synthetase B (glutamine-hydrolysing)
MCGIAGYRTTNAGSYKFKVATAILATKMEDRGGHSWGYMTDATSGHGLGSIDKGLRIPSRMPLAFALHTRYGTTGERSLANSHPFTVTGSAGTVVGVHNGIISNHRELNAKHARACAVDSQHIFEHIANGLPLNDLAGYGAIVYTLAGEWYIGRFNNGEMKVAVTPEGIFYASTRDAVAQAASYADLTITKWLKVANNTVYKLTTGGLVKSHRLNVAETSLRWDDDLLGRSSGAADDVLGRWRSHASNDAPEDSWCDSCYAPTRDLYAYDGMEICAGCFFLETDQTPPGYIDDLERSAYAYASTKAMAQGAR